MGEAPQRRLDTAEHDGGVGVEPLEDAGVDDGGHVGPRPGPVAGGVGVVGAPAAGGGVVVHHRVHASGADAEEEVGAAHFFEVPQVVLPVGLGHDGHSQSQRLEHPPDDGGAERGMVHVCVAREEHHVERGPSPRLHLLAGGGQPQPPVLSFHVLHLFP